MKKALLTIIILLVSGASLYAQQTPYYDAIQLSKLLDKTKHFKTTGPYYDTLCSILSKYSEGKLVLINDFKKKEKNPFLFKYFNQASTFSRGFGNVIQNVASSVGGLDVTNISDGLSKFLVGRVKQELSTAFFEKFQKELDSIPQLQVMFPSTFMTLHAMGDEIYNYTAYLDVLQKSFQKDLALLLPNLNNLVDDPHMDMVFKKFPEIRTTLSAALYLSTGISRGQFPGAVFHDYVKNKVKKDSLQMHRISPYLYPSLETLDLFSQSLRSTQAGKYWVSQDSLKLLFDPVTFDIYLGLIYQQAMNKGIVFNKEPLDSILVKTAKNTKQLKNFLSGLNDMGHQVRFAFQTIKLKQKTDSVKPTYQDYYSLIDASTNFLNYLTQFPLNDTMRVGNLAPNIKNYIGVVRSMGNIYVDSHEKQYASAIVELSSVFQNFFNSEKFNALVKNPGNASEKAIKQYEQVNALGNLILRYGSFAASVAKAQNSEEVKQAIEAIALPSGSSRVKRETLFNVSLNAYTGLYYGVEKIKGVDKKFQPNSYGLSAPVGIAISWGKAGFLNFCRKDGHWSHSFFISVIDVGALAAFRFQNDSIAQVPTVHLKDIISPGLFFSFGIPKSPLSVNLGAQMGPNLRKVNVLDESTGTYINKYQDNMYWRYSISLVVDIPVLNFYTKSK